MIKAVIADDIQILRQGLRAILEQDKDIRVVGLAADGREAWQLCRKHRPDVVLMDMRMPEYDGSYGITRIKEDYPDIKVLCSPPLMTGKPWMQPWEAVLTGIS